jgi:hypothetical protein
VKDTGGFMIKFRHIILFFITIVLLAANFVHADVYKCKRKDGVFVFSDRPCGKDAEIAFKGRSDAVGLNDLLANFETEVRTDEKPYNFAPAIEKFKSHTKLLGSYLFKNSEFQGFKKNVAKARWMIQTSVEGCWGPRSVKGVYRYTLTVGYKHEIRPDGHYVFRTGMVTIKKNDKWFDHPGMKDITCLQHVGIGWWK